MTDMHQSSGRAPSAGDVQVDASIGGPVALSETGLRRREAMLGDLLGHMAQTHAARRRRGRVAAGACAILLFACVTTMVLVIPTATSRPGRDGTVAGQGHAGGGIDSPTTADVASRVVHSEAAGSAFRIERISHTASAVRTVRTAEVQRKHVQVIDDTSLMESLGRLGIEAGIIRVEGRAFLAEPAISSRSDAENGLDSSRHDDANNSRNRAIGV